VWCGQRGVWHVVDRECSRCGMVDRRGHECPHPSTRGEGQGRSGLEVEGGGGRDVKLDHHTSD